MWWKCITSFVVALLQNIFHKHTKEDQQDIIKTRMKQKKNKLTLVTSFTESLSSARESPSKEGEKKESEVNPQLLSHSILFIKSYAEEIEVVGGEARRPW